jgi:hypothetical protein
MSRAPRLLLLACIAGCLARPSSEIQGTWSTSTPASGTSLVLTLSERAGSVSGTGAYTDGGRHGTLVVTGGYESPRATFTFNLSDGTSAAFTATIDSGRMRAVERFADGRRDTVTLTRH